MKEHKQLFNWSSKVNQRDGDLSAIDLTMIFQFRSALTTDDPSLGH